MKQADFILRYQWQITGITLLVVMASVIPLTRVTINPDLESYLPESIAPKVNTDKIAAVFGDQEPVILVFACDDVLQEKTLNRIRDLSRAFKKMNEFERVLSLFEMKNIRGQEGMMVVEPVIQKVPLSVTDREQLRKDILSNDLVYKLLVSEDFRYTLVILNVRGMAEDAAIMDAINHRLKENPGDETVYINGQPYLRDEANRKIGHDMMLLLPIGLIIMFFFLWFSFKEVRGVLLPFSVVVFSTLIAMALIPLFGWELSIIGILIPIMMIAIANNYGVYFITKYQELNATMPEITMDQIAVAAYDYLKKPVILCGLTTIAGVLGLVAHILHPARQMGIIAALGIGFALLISLLYIPALMSVLKKGRVQKSFTGEVKRPVDRIMLAMAGFSTARPKRVVSVFIALMIICSAGLFRFKVASDSNNILPRNHPFNISLGIMNTHFGGNKIISLLFEGDIREPYILQRLDRYEKELERLPEVGSVTSIATVIRKISTALNDQGERGYDSIPSTREAVAQYLELYSMSGDPDDFEDMVDFDYTRALLTVQYQAGSMDEINHVTGEINRLTRDDPALRLTGGYSLIDKEICRSVVTGQYQSLFFAFLAIMLMLMLLFKSLLAGLLGSLPLLFAVICTFGIMGWTGIELNIVTALLSSISIGLGVDFTIQMFWKLKTEMLNGQSYSSAIHIALKTMGRGISINAFSVMAGFSVLFLSAFPIIRSFASLIILSLFLCLSCALVLIPALTMLIRPSFLTKIK